MPDDFFLEGNDKSSSVSVLIGIFLGELRGDQVHYGAGLREADSGFKARDHVQIMAATIAAGSVVRKQGQRPPQIHGVSMRGRMKIAADVQDVWRHHANHDEGFA